MLALLYSTTLISLNPTLRSERLALPQSQKRASASEIHVGNHPAKFDSFGHLKPWTSWRDAIAREIRWYAKCPLEHGYPRFITLTFMRGDYTLNPRRHDSIPAMQNGMGILGYLALDDLKLDLGRQVPGRTALDTAKAMADYLLNEALTPNDGLWPRFPRSTGKAMTFPLPADCGSQADKPYEIQPDKGAIVGHALVLLYQRTHEPRYLEEAKHIADLLAKFMIDGDAAHSPWPFRFDYRNGASRGPVSADMSFALRLFNELAALGNDQYKAPSARLWRWIKSYQLPSIDPKGPTHGDGRLWVNFFEDYDLDTNRNAWSPLNLARYLVEAKESMDLDWKKDARSLIDFVAANFTSVRQGIPVSGEQDDDKDPWGGACSTYGGVLALYTAATGDLTYKAAAYTAITYCLYAVDNDGCPGQQATGPDRGGWQEDAFTDVLHNVLDAIKAFPEWADAR
jgi:hypothetical protein